MSGKGQEETLAESKMNPVLPVASNFNSNEILTRRFAQ